MSRTIVFLLAGLLCATPVWGVGIVEQTTFVGQDISSPGVTFWGQSFTTPVGGPWNNLTFNFYKYESEVYPAAVGTLYILDEYQLYAGETPPDQLSDTSFGYVAHSEKVDAYGTGTAWYFPSAVQLQGGKKYWAFMDDSGYWEDYDKLLVNGNDPYTSGDSFFAMFDPTFGYGAFASFYYPNDLNFSLNGDPVSAVPEPGAALLLGTGLLGLVGLRRKLAV